MKRRTFRIVAGLLLCTLTIAGCVPGVRAGARCRTADFGDDGTYVLKCNGGRWARVATKRAVGELIVGILLSRTTSTSQKSSGTSLVGTWRQTQFATLPASVSITGNDAKYAMIAESVYTRGGCTRPAGSLFGELGGSPTLYRGTLVTLQTDCTPGLSQQYEFSLSADGRTLTIALSIVDGIVFTRA